MSIVLQLKILLGLAIFSIPVLIGYYFYPSTYLNGELDIQHTIWMGILISVLFWEILFIYILLIENIPLVGVVLTLLGLWIFKIDMNTILKYIDIGIKNYNKHHKKEDN